MKFYINTDENLLTEKQVKEEYFNEDAIFDMLLSGYFQDEFIKICKI